MLLSVDSDASAKCKMCLKEITCNQNLHISSYNDSLNSAVMKYVHVNIYDYENRLFDKIMNMLSIRWRCYYRKALIL